MKIIADSRDREVWLAARMRYLCSSEAAAALNEGKGELDRAQLVMLKAGLAEPWKGNETTLLGRCMEPFFIEAARSMWGWKLEPFGLLVEDPACQFLAATPDFIARSPWGDWLVQTKVTTSQAHEDCRPTRRDGSESQAAYVNGAPLHHVIQQQAEMAATGFEWNALLVLHAASGRLKLRSYLTRRHSGAIARIRSEAVKVMADAETLRGGDVGLQRAAEIARMARRF